MSEYRIYGPPGTGKTTYVARQLAAAETAGRDPFVASFTRAAAAELAGRSDLPADRIGTLHSFCYQLLERPTIAEEKAHAEFSDYKISRISAAGVNDMDGPATLSDGDALLSAYNVYRQRLVPLEAMPARVQLFAGHWERWKLGAGYWDFTDLVDQTYRLGLPPPGRLGFFDEAQDMTPLDFALARRWESEYLDDVVFVGDEDQVIYEWRGASPDGLLEPALPTESIRVLGQSFRLPRTVHEYATRWIEQVERRADKPFAPRDDEGQLTIAGHEHDPAALADMLEAVPDGETALALASNGYALTDLRTELMQRGAVFHHPWRRQHAAWNPLGAASGGGTRARLLRMISRPWTYGDVVAFLAMFRLSGVTRRGMAKTLEEQPADLQAADSDLQAIFEDGVLDMITAWPMEFAMIHAKEARRPVLEYLAKIVDRHGLGALADPRPRITIGTIHSLKGGEGDHVFVLPDMSRAAAEAQHGSRRGRDATTRLYYVAMTRARRSLTLLGSRSSRAVRWLPV